MHEYNIFITYLPLTPSDFPSNVLLILIMALVVIIGHCHDVLEMC